MNPTPREAAGIVRRLASMGYEALVLIALLMTASLVFLLIAGEAGSPLMKAVFQIYLLLVSAGYFTWFWTHGGQTLAMKTWRIRLVSADGGAVPVRQALVRYVFALIGITLLGIGTLWALIDRDRQFLHDRLAGTRIVCS